MRLRHTLLTSILQLLLCAALPTLLASCGFHPRAELALPSDLGVVKVQSASPYSPLADSLTRSLQRAGALAAVLGCAPQGSAGTAVENPSATGSLGVPAPGTASTAVSECEPAGSTVAKAQTPGFNARTATLRIASETFTEGPLSVDNFSRVREYLITYVVRFEFTAADGSVLTPLQEVKLQRDFTYDASHALGSTAEQGTIRDEMQRDMAASILRRVGIALRNKTP